MSGRQRFDFRPLLTQPPSFLAGRTSRECVIGVAWTGMGVALVALAPDAAAGSRLTAYNNIVLGPVEGDWEEIERMIGCYLPHIFSDKSVQVFVSEALDPAGRTLPVGCALEAAFPGRVEFFTRDAIESWVADNPLHIACPVVAANERWAVKPLLGAAEVALYAGRSDGLFGQPVRLDGHHDG